MFSKFKDFAGGGGAEAPIPHINHDNILAVSAW